MRWLLAAALFLGGHPLQAQEVARVPIIGAPPGTPALGGGIRLNSSPYVNQSGESDLVPLYLYEGEYLYAHGTKFGIHALQTDNFSINLGARFQFAKLLPDPDDSFYDGVEERQQTWELGLEGAWQGRLGILQAGWWADANDRHGGQSAELTYRYRFDFGRWMISPYLTARWLNGDFTDYYYGVSASEARPDLPEYQVGDAVNIEWGVNTWYQFNPSVFAFANLGMVTLDSSISKSPLVAEESGVALFTGAGYLFGGEKTNVYKDGQSTNPWSWRVNYGYQAHSNIFPNLMGGKIRSSDLADSHIGGLTVGRLFQGGERVEMWGKFALYRHFEEPEQDNFWSYNAYMMLKGKGYSPWSEQLLFRWGFGLGVSYAQEVPIVEQIKQERKGEKTNRLLNYLEFQVDFPLERLFKSKHVKDCFVGMTVAHRSGIFATSDILGSVNGGSDWVTFHYECVR